MYTYWVLLALGLLPLIYAHCLDTGDPGMPISRWVLVMAAITWAMLFSPLPQPGGVTVAVSLIEVVWINFVSVISADLLWSQVEVYAIDLKLLVSTSMLTAIASCVLVALLHITSDPSPREEDDDALFGITQTPFVQSLTLFVSLSTCAVTISVGIIRRVLNRAFLNVRYDNSALGALIALNASSGLALVAIPPPWNVPVNRGIQWSVLFMALTLRRVQVRMFFAPLRDGTPPEDAAAEFSRSIPPPAPVLCGAAPFAPPPHHGVISRARHRIMTREEIPFAV